MEIRDKEFNYLENDRYSMSSGKTIATPEYELYSGTARRHGEQPVRILNVYLLKDLNMRLCLANPQTISAIEKTSTDPERYELLLASVFDCWKADTHQFEKWLGEIQKRNREIGDADRLEKIHEALRIDY